MSDIDAVIKDIRIEIRESRDIIAARGQARQLARRAGFGLADQTRLATALSEVARNAMEYAGMGRCIVRDESNDDRVCISVEVVDHGPGIPDLDQVLSDGCSTANNLGAGLPGARRITSGFHVESSPGHTRVHFRIERPRGRPDRTARVED